MERPEEWTFLFSLHVISWDNNGTGLLGEAPVNMDTINHGCWKQYFSSKKNKNKVDAQKKKMNKVKSNPLVQLMTRLWDRLRQTTPSVGQRIKTWAFNLTPFVLLLTGDRCLACSRPLALYHLCLRSPVVASAIWARRQKELQANFAVPLGFHSKGDKKKKSTSATKAYIWIAAFLSITHA